MAALFLKLLNLSLTAGWLVLAVIAVRPLLRRAPKWITCALWAVVAVRLLCPVSIESALSLIPTAEPVPSTLLQTTAPTADNTADDGDFLPADPPPQAPATTAPTTPAAKNPWQIATHVASWVWLSGTAALLCWAAISYARLRAKMRTAVRLDGRVWQSERVNTPFVLGIFRPRIYLPFTLSDEDADYVLAHETAHIRRRDHLIKPLAFLLLSIYWFHPLLWVAYVLLCRDIELACDERVVKAMDRDHRCAYSAALVRCSVRRHTIAACPLAFGEVSVKERVKRVLHYKKPAFWVLVVALVACAAVTVCFATTPKTETNDDSLPAGQNFTVLQTDSTAEGVSLALVDITYVDGTPCLLVKWTNDTANDITYGSGFGLHREENGEWVDTCTIDNLVFTAIGYPFPAKAAFVKSYALHHFDLSTPGTYRFTSTCHFDKDVPITEEDELQLSITFEYKGAPAAQATDSLQQLGFGRGVFSAVKALYKNESNGESMQAKFHESARIIIQDALFEVSGYGYSPTEEDTYSLSPQTFTVGNPRYEKGDMSALEKAAKNGGMPTLSLFSHQTELRVLTADGNDTGYRLYQMDNEQWLGYVRTQGGETVYECLHILQHKSNTAVVTEDGTYYPVAVRHLPAHSSSTADYYLQTHVDPFTIAAEEFAYGKMQITDPVYKAVDAASLVAEEFSGLLPRYPADAIERCCCVSNPNGSGTNFYLFSTGDRLMVGHYRMFGAANPTLSCEYLMELDTGGKSATAIIDSLMNA